MLRSTITVFGKLPVETAEGEVMPAAPWEVDIWHTGVLEAAYNPGLRLDSDTTPARLEIHEHLPEHFTEDSQYARPIVRAVFLAGEVAGVSVSREPANLDEALTFDMDDPMYARKEIERAHRVTRKWAERADKEIVKADRHYSFSDHVDEYVRTQTETRTANAIADYLERLSEGGTALPMSVLSLTATIRAGEWKQDMYDAAHAEEHSAPNTQEAYKSMKVHQNEAHKALSMAEKNLRRAIQKFADRAEPEPNAYDAAFDRAEQRMREAMAAGAEPSKGYRVCEPDDATLVVGDTAEDLSNQEANFLVRMLEAHRAGHNVSIHALGDLEEPA